jgi:hypothetical protein
MKRFLTGLAAAAALALSVPGAAAAAPGEFAAGRGDNGQQQFAFFAFNRADGATGQMSVRDIVGPVQLRNHATARVTCLTLDPLTGKAATVVGVITSDNPPRYPRGAVLGFNVADSDDSAPIAPDTFISFVGPAGAVPCPFLDVPCPSCVVAHGDIEVDTFAPGRKADDVPDGEPG